MAEAATARMDHAIATMANFGAALLSQIKGHAAITGDGVYQRAMINEPAKRSPIAEPGKPGSFKVELTELGSVVLSWKCKNPRGAVGTLYKISRRTNDTGSYEFIGLVGEKKFEDATIPLGTQTASYRVQAVRSKKAGLIGEQSVIFGVSENIPRAMFEPENRAA